MNTRSNILQDRWSDARDDLIFARERLAALRDRQLTAGFLWNIAITRYYTALDRAWEAQCMAQAAY